MLIDSHAHLGDSAFDENRKEIIKNFDNDRLLCVVEAGCCKNSILNAVKLANENAKMFAIIGVHPENDFEFDDEAEKIIRDNCSNPKVIGIGEVGLDYFFKDPNKERQKQVFLAQAKIAHENALPVCVHLRDAYGDFMELIRNNLGLFEDGLLLHCYSGSPEFARQMMMLVSNCYFAFGGTSTFKNAVNVRQCVKEIPIDRILSETDSPFLTPEPKRGKEKNQPKNVDFVVQKIADIKEMSKDKMEKIIEENFRRLFKKFK